MSKCLEIWRYSPSTPRGTRQPEPAFPCRVTVRSRGYDGQRAMIQVHSADREKTEPLASLPITLTGGEQAHELVLETDQAKGPLTVELPVLPHEAIAANNRVPFQIAPRPSAIRVLYMEGTPPPEQRWLQEARGRPGHPVHLVAGQQPVCPAPDPSEH